MFGEVKGPGQEPRGAGEQCVLAYQDLPCVPQGEIGEPGQKGSKGDKGDQVGAVCDAPMQRDSGLRAHLGVQV